MEKIFEQELLGNPAPSPRGFFRNWNDMPDDTEPARIYKWPAILNALRIADLVAMIFAGLAGHYLRFGKILPSQPSEHLFLYLSSVVIVVSLHLAGGYRLRALGSLNPMLRTLFVGGSGALLALLSFGFLSGTLASYSRIWLVASAAIGAIALVVNRVLLAQFVRRAVASGRLVERIVLVGANDVADKIIASILAADSKGIRVLGLFEDRVKRQLPGLSGIPVLGNTNELLAYVRTKRVDRIIVTLPWISSDRINALLKKLRTVPVRIDLVPQHDVVWQSPAVNLERLAGIPVLTVANAKVDEQIGIVKRIEDIVISGALLIMVSPLLLLIALAIRLDSKGPVIFRQKRHGFNNEVFDVYKFRSMRQADSMSAVVRQATKGDPRITRIGRFLRKSSLDELPQLFNVLFGTMSIVGPRPHAVQHGNQYAEIITEYFARHNVKPGITGWAQVNGLRGETDTDDKMRRRVEYDLHYIEHWSLLLDLKIILMTAVAVWFQETAY